MLSKKTVNANGTETVYNTEYPENASPVLKIKANGRTVESHSKTDSFGRKVFDEIQTGRGFVSRQFSYFAGEVTPEHKQNDKLKSSPTTNLVSQIVLSDGSTLSYTYDEEERITSVTETYEVDGAPVVKVTAYTYDALGQLLTETVNGTVVNTMTYDNYGNICTKNGVEYTYDEVWKDKLTSFNGQSINYDAQGNRTNYCGYTLTWEKGRQLKSIGSTVFTYNANGVRTSKFIFGTELHEYTVDGTKILEETWNGNHLVPIYDNSDSVCGIMYNGESYFFLKNLQGDIIAIANSNGETVVRYSYDAWGNYTILQDTTTQGIANINPFRYRGYYLDREIGLYYLNSRYYDANTGRFINADSPEYVSIQGGNLFSYCGNCPTKNADYFGFCYVPTYDETSISSGSGKKKEDGILITFLKTIGIMSSIVVAFGVSALNYLADIQEKYPKLETVVMILDAICTVGKYFFAPLKIAEVVIEVIDALLTISKRNKTTEDWLGIIKEIVLKILDIDILKRLGKFLKGEYD